tara:strand:+ start:91 stop:312 length:222 start_codon:yes stop_codon:yes gene_type:complete
MKSIILFFITLCQKSSGGKRLFGIDCNFKPTCSEYTKQAIFELGLFKGLICGLKRIRKFTDKDLIQKISDPFY